MQYVTHFVMIETSSKVLSILIVTIQIRMKNLSVQNREREREKRKKTSKDLLNVDY